MAAAGFQVVAQLTYPAEYCTIRPFRDHPSQLFPRPEASGRFNMRTTRALSSPSSDLGTLHTRRSPSLVWTANISDFCFDEEACHANVVMVEGCIEVVVRVCSIVKAGDKAAMSTEPLLYLLCNMQSQNVYLEHCGMHTYPKANALQSAVGAIAHRGSNIVRAVIASAFSGLKSMRLPKESPASQPKSQKRRPARRANAGGNVTIPKTRFPFFIHDATRISSYASYCESTSPESISQTIAVLDLSTLTTRVATTSLILSTAMMVTFSL